MPKSLLMGNEAIALGAMEAGLHVAAAYPGTPSSEIVGTLAEKAKEYGIYAEWSVNEKVAMEVAGGAAYAGANALVAMKQVGLNVASDPLMSLAYIGVKGALVVAVADDPGPHSSQTEQDTRTFAKFAKLPVFDPSTPEEAREMTKAAFELSHRHGMAVFLRPTTRVCHACSEVTFDDSPREKAPPSGFEKDPRWVIFPRLSYQRHQWLEKQREILSEEFSDAPWNFIIPGGRLGVVTSGVSYLYVREALARLGVLATILKVGTPYPLPERLIKTFLNQVDQVLVVEELDPVIEEGIKRIGFDAGNVLPVYGKQTGHLPYAGEYSIALVEQAVLQVTAGENAQAEIAAAAQVEAPELPVRPPVLCAGCPHRASFYAAKMATRGMDTIYSGDIGCYTLGNAPPLSLMDTCLCMGAGITVASGLHLAEPERVHMAFIGDSTFFHTGLPGLINAVYNQNPIKLLILDNSTTAMTGHQPHPGMGRTAVGQEAKKLDIETLVRACGVEFVRKADPFDHKAAMEVVKEAVAFPGPAVVIMERPCIALFKKPSVYTVDRDTCVNCGKCLRDLGCPAMAKSDKPLINATCYGCGLCAQICPTGAIKEVAP